MNYSCFIGKRVFITGITGFKGTWLALWLNSIGAEVMGYALMPNTEPSMYNEIRLGEKIPTVFDSILNEKRLLEAVVSFRPDIVFHLAAQAIVRYSYRSPLLTYQTNVIGTLNVLEAARKAGTVRNLICVTSDKCYENPGDGSARMESDPMGGWDIYSSSKGCAEILCASYRRSFLMNGEPGYYDLATVRAGNVIGGGDWAQNRLIPDCVRSINMGTPIEIRNPDAIRPWQHVLEPLSGYILLSKLLLEGSHKFVGGFNFGPEDNAMLTVIQVASKVINNYGAGKVSFTRSDNLHEDKYLTLSISKAQRLLGWQPKMSADEAIAATVAWYKAFYSNTNDMCEFTLRQLHEYMDKLDSL